VTKHGTCNVIIIIIIIIIIITLLFPSSSPCIVQPAITLGYNSFGGYESGVLFEKLKGSQPVKKLPAFYGTRMFITAFKKASHLYLP